MECLEFKGAIIEKKISKINQMQTVFSFKIWHTVKMPPNISFHRSAHCSFVFNYFKSKISQILPSWKARSTHSRSNALSDSHCGVKFPFLMQFKPAKFQVYTPYRLEVILHML